MASLRPVSKGRGDFRKGGFLSIAYVHAAKTQESSFFGCLRNIVGDPRQPGLVAGGIGRCFLLDNGGCRSQRIDGTLLDFLALGAVKATLHVLLRGPVRWVPPAASTSRSRAEANRGLAERGSETTERAPGSQYPLPIFPSSWVDGGELKAVPDPEGSEAPPGSHNAAGFAPKHDPSGRNL